MFVLNVWLYLMFLFNPPGYRVWVAAGAPCYGYVASLGAEAPSAPPVCFYDPSNTNPAQ